MSDFFLSCGNALDEALVARDLRFTNYTQVQSGVCRGATTWAISRVDDIALWGPAWDARSRTRVLIGGRIALEETDWAAAERLPFEGGLAARHILSQWLTLGANGVAAYNGAAVVLIVDEIKGEAHIWTDRMGFFPAFALHANGVIIASHPDVIARMHATAGRPLEVDEVTVAEFLRTGNPVHPYTYWKKVHSLDAASQFHLNLHDSAAGLRKRRQYWQPAFVEGAASLPTKTFVEALADRLRAAGRRRSWGRLGRTALLLSAGVDSRGVLASMQSPSDVDCYTYFDEPNAELRGAQRIAALANARHFALRRSPDYYVANAEETVRLSGGMWGIKSGHHTGFMQTIREQSNPGSVLSGEFCDILFKGLALNKRHIQLFGRNLPLYELSPYDHEYYLPFAPLASDWQKSVDARLEEAAPTALQCDLDPRKIELRRLLPLARFGGANSRLTLWRLAPFDVLLADNDLLDLYGRLSVADKISGIAFGQAVARVTGPRIAAVANNNYGGPVGTTEARRVTDFLLASAARKLKRVAIGPSPNSLATTGSWPDYRYVALGSPLMRSWFEDNLKGHGEQLLGYLHPSRRRWTFDDFAMHDHFQLFRLTTASLWLNSTKSIAYKRHPGADEHPSSRMDWALAKQRLNQQADARGAS